MKGHIDWYARAQRWTIAAGAIVAISALEGFPASAWADAVAPSHSATAGKGQTAQGIDALINHLHDQLKITAEQEQLWQKVVTVMRENADELNKLAKARSDSAKTATAVDDLQSYSQISQAHADGTKRLIPSFQALYDSMTDDQKKLADAEFREHYHGHHHHSH